MKPEITATFLIVAIAWATVTPLDARAYMVGPPEGLAKMTTNADLVCKARMISFTVITNDAFRPLPGFETHDTCLELISTLKGAAPSAFISFLHYAASPQGMWMYSPQHYELAAGQCYLIFATKAEQGKFQQIRKAHTGKADEGVMRTLDHRTLPNLSVKDAHWLELNRLLNDTVMTNQIYAVRQLDALSKKSGQEWDHTDDFQREAVLTCLWPLATHANDEVALAALNCFSTRAEDAVLVAPFTDGLIQIAGSGASIPRRVAAIAAFAGANFPGVSKALPQWLSDPSADVRLQAVMLLPNFAGEFAERALRERASDASPNVRAGVADAIGNGKMVSMLSTLQTLLSDPVGRTNPVPPLTIAEVQSGGRVWGSNNGDVHTAAGFALLKFDVSKVGDILKANLTDEAFRPNYLCKLAETDCAPWLTNLVEVMESRRIRVEQEVDASGIAPKDRHNYLKARMVLSGTYHKCWHIMVGYLKTLSAESLGEAHMERCLHALENAGTTGSQEPVALYELYRSKGLHKRAAQFRQQHGNASVGYDLAQYFDRVDERLHLPPP